MNFTYGAVGLLLLACAHLCAAPAVVSSDQYLMYFGTYTGFKYMELGTPAGVSRSKGIYVSRFRVATGEVSEPQLVAAIANPSFLAIHPNGRFLYAISEDPLSVGPPRDHASYVSAYAIDRITGKLNLLNTMPTGGTSTCYVSLDKTGKYLFMANFGSGSVSVLRVKEDGSLGEETSFMQHIGRGKDPFFQSQAHPHSIDASPDNRFAIVADLGLDKAFVYRFRADSGALEPVDPPFVSAVPGGGPRHFIFDRNGRFAYLLSEMSGIVTVYAWDATAGTLSQMQEVETIPHSFIGQNDSAEIAIHPNGAFLYESNRRRRGKDWWVPDTIGVFSIDPKTGRLTAIEQVPTQGTMPRHFAIDPSGSYLFAENELSGGVIVFRVDAGTGRLSPAGRAIHVDTPVCIQFVPVK